uniref:Mastermind-like protein 1 n=1 Tax=Sinocyclocheilus grahami TaxID=75366 RepID=A0A672KHI8_SINGR
MLKQQQQQQLARMPNSMPNAMTNNMGSAMPTSMPTSIQGALPAQAQSWQQQQHPGLQPGSANGGMPAGFPNSGFHMQPRLSKLSNNTPFPQGGMGNSAAGRTLTQAQAPPQTQQVLSDLGPFSQPQAGPNRTAGLQCSQAYQINRTANQQLQFSYNAQSGGSLSGFPAETDLVDSLLKNPSTQEWMDDLDELLASHQ